MPAYKDGKRNTWYVRFYYTDWTGQRKQKTKRGFNTMREAKKYENDFLAAPPTGEHLTFGELYEIYLQDMIMRLKPQTINTKTAVIRKRILPYFKNKVITDILPKDIRMWQNEMIKTNLSKTYMRELNGQLSAILNYAVKYYGLLRNPCKIAGTIGESKADEVNFWTDSEFKQFINVVKDPRYHVIFNLFYWGGLRKGELMALKPNDLFEYGVNISKSASWIKGNLVITTTKTKKSSRKVTLPKFCYDELCNYINKQYGISDDDLIFDISSNTTINKALERYANCAGVKKIRVHDLRHSHAALCIDMNMNIKALSDRLGHEDIQTTLNIYGHLYPDKQKEIADALEQKANGKFDLKGQKASDIDN